MNDERLWPKVRAYLLWAVSAGIALVAFVAAVEMLRVISAAIWPPDPLRTVEWGGRVRLTQILGFLFLGIGWIAWLLGMLHSYTSARTLSSLLRRFAIMTLIQAAIFGLWWIMPTLIRLLA